MYDNIYTYNFILNFILSFVFLLFNVIFSICLSGNEKVKAKISFGEFQPLVIFFLVFCLYVFALSIATIINHKIISIVFFVILFFQSYFIFKNYKNLNKLKINILFNEKLILTTLFALFLISILPLSDADSIAIYQYLPSNIFLEGLNDINLDQNLEFSLLTNTEIILLISTILKSDNFGSQLNLIVLIFFITIKFKDHKNFLLIVLSSPLIIYFISAQKLQLFFGILFLLNFILIEKKLIKNKLEIFIFLLLLVFYSSGKMYYALFSLTLYIYYFINNENDRTTVFLYSVLCFLIVFVPLLTIKQIYFGNVLAPFFDNIFGNNLEIYNAFVYSIRSNEGWLNDIMNWEIFLRPFISFNPQKLSSSLGLIFLLMLFDLKLHKKTKYIPLVLIILVIITGQILPRYYLEAFLLLGFYYNFKNKFIKFFLISQVTIIFLISTTYLYISYIKLNVMTDKNQYMNRFSYSFFNANKLKKLNLNGNILDFSLDRNTIFLDKNSYSLRNIKILNNFNRLNEVNLVKFINKNSIKYLIINDNDIIPNCLILKKIDETVRLSAMRNFLVKAKKNKYAIVKIEDNTCL